MTDEIVISSFYKFQKLPTYIQMREPLLEICNLLELKGTILLAEEGINATLAGKAEALEHLYEYLKDFCGLEIDNQKLNCAEFIPFRKMKVRLKEEIVSMKVPGIDVANDKGEYIEPENWDKFISCEDVLTIDTRNEYETVIGTFEGSIDPKTKSFREFPEWVKNNKSTLEGKKIAMFCTGGIRCEKSTAYLKQLGYKEVYHLKGGILSYLEKKLDNASKKWRGDCFVFDDRMAVNEELVPSSDIFCSFCSGKMDTDSLKNNYRESSKIICNGCYKMRN